MRDWIIRLVAVSALTSAAMAIAPEGAAKKALGAVCAFVMLSAALSCVFKMDSYTYALNLEQYREEGERIATKGQESSQTETRLVIQETSEAYILDKAAQLGVNIARCKVRAIWSTEGYWVPYSCTISSEGGMSDALSVWIEAQLGIPRESQEWITLEE